jgi:hypothetical protein
VPRPSIDFSAPDYGPIYEYRRQAALRLLKQRGAIASAREFYRTHWVEFINDWGMTFDPRKDHDKESPFILFPKQEEYVNWVYQLWKTRRRGLGEKSREVGFTWLSAAIAACMWLFEPNSVVGFGSRKKELVDNGNDDPDSIFWKVRMFIDNLPEFFLPPDWEDGRKSMVVPNRSNGAVIKGEIGDEIGRGGRSSIYFADEFAHLEHQDMAESALSQNTDCRIYISTVNGVGNLFYRLRQFLPREQIFIFDWTDDPRKRINPEIPPEEEEWYLTQKANLLPTTLASQVNRDYNAAVANAFIRSELIRQGEETHISSIIQPPQTPWRIGVDAAGLGNDEIIVWRRRGRLSLPPLVFRHLDGVQLATIVERECKRLLDSAPVALIGIERDGPGGSCADQLKYGPFASVTCAVHTGAKLADGEHYNLRAWLHAQARDYMESNEIHLPRDDTFASQATAIQYEYKGGLLLIESKDDYRSRFAMGKSKAEKRAGRSPDRWDAFVLTFIPNRSKPIASAAEKFPGFSGSKAWRPLDAVMGY